MCKSPIAWPLILEYFHQHTGEMIRPKHIHEDLQLSRATIHLVLKQMVERELLEKVAGPPITHYIFSLPRRSRF